MPKQPIAVELEAINRDGETQVMRDSGLTVHGYLHRGGHLPCDSAERRSVSG